MRRRDKSKPRAIGAYHGIPEEINKGLYVMFQDINDKVTEEAKAKLQDMFGQVDSLSDPQAQIVRFFDAIHQGMPSPEAAEYFLHLDAEQFERFREDNAETDRLIRDFEGRVALEQYRKVCRDGTPREALEWLRVNRSDKWKLRSSVTFEDMRKAVEDAPSEGLMVIANLDPNSQ